MPTTPDSASPVLELSLASPAGELSGPEFHLIPDSAAAGVVAPLELSAGVSALRWDERNAAPVVAAPDGDERVLLEPVRAGGRWRLLLAAAAGVELRHNDLLAPGLLLLREGDQLAIDGGPALELALYSRPQVGPVPAEGVGVPCLVCRLALESGARCYRCSCGKFLHSEEGEDALQCALTVNKCQACGQPITFSEGYLGTPQFLTKEQE